MRYTAKNQARVLFFSFTAAFLVITGHVYASTLSAPPTTPMEKGARASAPLAYFNFCQRHADQCGSSEQRLLSASLSGNAVASAVSDDHRGPASTTTRPNAAFNWQAVFVAPATSIAAASPRLDAHLTQVSDEEAPGSASMAFPAANEATWAQLERVNTDVNRRVRSISDISHYGVEDYWELPFDGGGDAGDCEDYALQKRQLLTSLHIPASALSIAIVKTTWNEPHAVLLVRTDSGAYVLDNLTSEIKPWKDVRYRWVKWQSSGNPDIWLQPVP